MAAKQTNLEVKTRFGRRKMSDDQYADQLDKKSRSINASGVRFGRRKVEPVPAAPVAAAAPTPPAEQEKGGESGNPFLVNDARLSIAKVEAHLVAHPEQLDLAIHTEFDGVHGAPRKGALQLFRDIEEASETPRQRIIALLASAGAE